MADLGGFQFGAFQLNFQQEEVTGGSIVGKYSGVSTANGVTYFKGISSPTIILTDAEGGTFNVLKSHQVSGDLNPGTVTRETYIIDGELP